MAERSPRTGRVTKVKTQIRDGNRMSVFVEGTFSFGMPLDAAFDLGIATGVELDEALLEQCLAVDERYRARRKALDLLSFRPRSSSELQTRLIRAGYSDEASTQAVDRMRELGYLDDEAFATAFARERLVSKGLGPRRVLEELRKKGIPAQTAERIVGQEAAGRDETADAMRQADRFRARLEREPDARKRRQKLWAFLSRKGFGADTVRAVIESVLASDGTVRRVE